jgi:hypothetical protein
VEITGVVLQGQLDAKVQALAAHGLAGGDGVLNMRLKWQLGLTIRGRSLHAAQYR